MEQAFNNLIVDAKKNVRPGGVLKLPLKERDGVEFYFSIPIFGG